APPGPAPLGPAPLGPAPLGPAPLGPAPLGPAPLGPAPLGPAPLGPAPLGPAPLGPAPLGPAPLGPAPLGPIPPGLAPPRPALAAAAAAVAAGGLDGASGCCGRGRPACSGPVSGPRRAASVGSSSEFWSGRTPGSTAAASGAWCRPTAGYGAPSPRSLATAAAGPPVPVTPPSCPAAGPATAPATGGPLGSTPAGTYSVGSSRIVRSGEKNTGSRASSEPITDTHSVGRSPIVAPRIPPSSDPIGIVPHTANRIVAFIRPSSRSGQSSCRNDTWVML